MSHISDYDIIVIGAGCGGLSAAVCAAREGKRVLVLEKNDKPGGLTTSFIRGRFKFETTLSHLSGFTKNPGSGEMRRLLDAMNITDKLQWTSIPEAYRLITKNRDGSEIDVIMPFGSDNYINTMERYVPGSKKAMITLFSIAEEIEKAVHEIESIQDEFDRKTIKQIIKKYPNFIHTAPYSANEVFEAIGLPQKAIDILNAMWVHFGVDCDRFIFTHYISYLYTYIKYGSMIPVDRSSSLINALVDEFNASGGTIIYNNPVTKILFDDEQACGVTTNNGETFLCKHIICNCSPTVAYAKLMKDATVPESAVKRTNARLFGARSACVYLGLNRSAEELGIKDYSVYISDEADTSDQFTLMKAIETNNAQRAVCLNLANPGCSPDGTTILCLSTIYTDDCWADVQAEQYFDEKDMLAARLIANYETATGITIHNSIEELEVATPVTFARYTGTPQGVTHGYLATDWDNLITRFMTEATDNDTKGLRFCGAWGTQLNGVGASIASGRNTAYATLCDIAEEGVSADE